MIKYILIPVVLLVIFAFYEAIKDVKEQRKKEKMQKEQRNKYTSIRIVNPDIFKDYVKVPLLTAREQEEYKILREAAKKKNLYVCPKVRLLDLVNPAPEQKNQRALLAKVMSKHVDFAICDYDMEVKCIIELDDTTHLRTDRIKRDVFVDSVLFGAGYMVKHVWEITPNILDDIKS